MRRGKVPTMIATDLEEFYGSRWRTYAPASILDTLGIA